MSTLNEQRRRISQFHLRTQVHEGRKCDVYESRYTKVGGIVESAAIKILQPHLACMGDELRSFLNEVHWARTIRHRLFPQVIEAGESEGYYFLAMNFVHGWGLSHVLQAVEEQGVFLPTYVGLAIARDIAVGVQTLHTWRGEEEKIGGVHLGIEPDNIMVRRSGRTCLLDFGGTCSGSKASQPPLDPSVFHSPEYLNGVLTSQQSDVFSLGQVLERMRSYMEEGALVGAGDDLIRRACHPSPGARFLTMAEMGSAIETLAEKKRLPLSEEVCANFCSIIFDSSVIRQEPLAQRPQGESFFHMSSENMKTVLKVPKVSASALEPVAQESSEILEEAQSETLENESPIVAAPKRLPTEVDEVEFLFERQQSFAEDPLHYKENVLEGDFGDDTDVALAPEAPIPKEDSQRNASEHLLAQGSDFSDEHQEVTAFMPAEAMAAMASVPQQPFKAKRKPKSAFPQELIPTRAYDSILPLEISDKKEKEE